MVFHVAKSTFLHRPPAPIPGTENELEEIL